MPAWGGPSPRTARGTRSRRTRRRGAPGRPSSSRRTSPRGQRPGRRPPPPPAARVVGRPPPPGPGSAPGHRTGARHHRALCQDAGTGPIGGRVPHDPVVAKTVRQRPSAEPRFVLAEQEERASGSLPAYGRRPNVLVILFDDVGWGDFGCYGGGVAVGAPTPNIDRLARRGMLLTSCYSEPSCTPSRASLMTGRLPMRHGLLRPPMYGQPGGLDGEVTLAQLLSDAGYVTQAVGKWHIGRERRVPAPARRVRRLLRLPVGVGHVHRVAGPELLPGDRLQRGAHRVGGEPALQQVLRPCHPGWGDRERRGGDRPGPLPARRASGPTYSLEFIRRMAEPEPAERTALVPLPLHPGRPLRQLSPRAVPRLLAGQASLQGHHHRARRHRRPAGGRARGHRARWRTP